MPGYNGTGPKGRGPMTGRGGGYCLLKLPGSADEPLSGFVGRAGLPVRFWPDGIGTDLASLSLRAQRLEAELRDMRRRIMALGQE
ncbi:MAG: DUF5320 domain-containing protein [Candidatus Aminicenantales bacterium]